MRFEYRNFGLVFAENPVRFCGFFTTLDLGIPAFKWIWFSYLQQKRGILNPVRFVIFQVWPGWRRSTLPIK